MAPGDRRESRQGDQHVCAPQDGLMYGNQGVCGIPKTYTTCETLNHGRIQQCALEMYDSATYTSPRVLLLQRGAPRYEDSVSEDAPGPAVPDVSAAAAAIHACCTARRRIYSGHLLD